MSSPTGTKDATQNNAGRIRPSKANAIATVQVFSFFSPALNEPLADLLLKTFLDVRTFYFSQMGLDGYQSILVLSLMSPLDLTPLGFHILGTCYWSTNPLEMRRWVLKMKRENEIQNKRYKLKKFNVCWNAGLILMFSKPCFMCEKLKKGERVKKKKTCS